MTNVEILVKGYASRKTDKASSSCVLIQENKINIIVDPGMDRKKLLAGLKKHGLKISDIDYVLISHTHIDHCGLAGIFENAKLIDDEALYSFDGGFKEHDISKIIMSDNIKIIKTPGHDPHHCSVLVKTDKGIIVIAEDVIWWWDDEDQKNDFKSIVLRNDPYEKNKTQLLASRKKILKIADWIIPGHGPIFQSENLNNKKQSSNIK